MTKINTKIYLDKDMLVWIQSRAELLRCSVSQVVRNLILKAMTSD